MKKLILALILISSYQVFSQAPILDSANFAPKIGDTLFEWDGNITNYFNPGASGANVYWDFSTINFSIPISGPSELFTSHLENYYGQNSNVIRIYDPVGTTPGTCEFRYYLTSSIFSYNGSRCYTGFSGVVNYYNPNKTMFTFPFTYLSYISDSVVDDCINSTGESNHYHDYYSIKADAWGTLKIQNVIHNNTLRLKAINFRLDSSNTILIKADTSYAWYKENCSYPLLSMGTGWSDNNGIWTNGKSTHLTPYGLDYTPVFLGVTDFDKESINIYPNPATDFLQIENISDKTVIAIYSIDGKLQKSHTVAENGIVKIKELAEGIYFIKFQNEKGIVCKKFIKNKQ